MKVLSSESDTERSCVGVHVFTYNPKMTSKGLQVSLIYFEVISPYIDKHLEYWLVSRRIRGALVFFWAYKPSDLSRYSQ
jgi:hypothetical protein